MGRRGLGKVIGGNGTSPASPHTRNPQETGAEGAEGEPGTGVQCLWERESLILEVDVVAHMLAVIIYAKQSEEEKWDGVAEVTH